MKVKTKTISVYVTEDGKEFSDHREAVIHDIALILPADLDMDVDEAATIIFDNRERVLELIKGFNKVNAQKPVRPAEPVSDV